MSTKQKCQKINFCNPSFYYVKGSWPLLCLMFDQMVRYVPFEFKVVSLKKIENLPH